MRGGIKRTKEDAEFSTFVRDRDSWTCQRCETKYPPRSAGLHCAHMFTRRTRATRHDPANALALCYGCHQYVDSHPTEKEALWIKKIGTKEFEMLRLRAHTTGPRFPA